MVQGEEERIRQYMTRFAKATLNIPDLHPIVTIHTFLIGFRPGEFLDTLLLECMALNERGDELFKGGFRKLFKLE